VNDMNDYLTTKNIRQKVLRESRQDGFIELWLGILFLYYSVFFDNFAREIPTQRAMIVLFILIVSYPVIHFNLIRNVFIYPRMGYVNTKEKSPLVPVLTFVAPATLLPLITFVAVHWLSDFVDIELLLRLMSVLFGVIFGGLYFRFARQMGIGVYHTAAVVSLVAGVCLSAIPLGVTIFLVLQSIFLLTYGMLLFVRFIRKYPRPGSIPNCVDKFEDDRPLGNDND